MRAKIIFGLILMLFIVIFTLQNSVSVPVKFFTWTYEMPVALIIVIPLALGVILGLLYSFSPKKPVKEIEPVKEGEPVKERETDFPLT